MEFIDRQSEIELLADHLNRPGAAMFVLYGRRRIGKTALLQELLGNHSGAAYHVGTRSTMSEELHRLSATLAQSWSKRFLQVQPLTSSAALLAFLESIEDTAVLALDEFPFLVESDPSLPGSLQASWDRALSRGKLKLILCGSSVAVMESTFLEPRAPLFGRRTGQLRLGPLPTRELVQVFPYSPVELIELAATFGGIPGYLQRLDPERKLTENLRRHVLRRGEPLYEEIPFLLREELREPRVYHAILSVVAGGARKFGEISSKVGLDRANLSRYLATLIDLGFMEREVPATIRHPEKSRKGLYRIQDPFLATWFALVHPFRDQLERDPSNPVIDEQILPRFKDRLAQAVEPVIRELFLHPPLSELIPFSPDRSGRYWSPTAEFDLVFIDRERHRCMIGELKWSHRKISPSLLDDLRRRVAGESEFNGLEPVFALISREGFTRGRKLAADERLVDLSSMDWR